MHGPGPEQHRLRSTDKLKTCSSDVYLVSVPVINRIQPWPQSIADRCLLLQTLAADLCDIERHARYPNATRVISRYVIAPQQGPINSFPKTNESQYYYGNISWHCKDSAERPTGTLFLPSKAVSPNGLMRQPSGAGAGFHVAAPQRHFIQGSRVVPLISIAIARNGSKFQFPAAPRRLKTCSSKPAALRSKRRIPYASPALQGSFPIIRVPDSKCSIVCEPFGGNHFPCNSDRLITFSTQYLSNCKCYMVDLIELSAAEAAAPSACLTRGRLGLRAYAVLSNVVGQNIVLIQKRMPGCRLASPF